MKEHGICFVDIPVSMYERAWHLFCWHSCGYVWKSMAFVLTFKIYYCTSSLSFPFFHFHFFVFLIFDPKILPANAQWTILTRVQILSHIQTLPYDDHVLDLFQMYVFSQDKCLAPVPTCITVTGQLLFKDERMDKRTNEWKTMLSLWDGWCSLTLMLIFV